MACRLASNQQRLSFHKSHPSRRVLSFLLVFPLVAAASAALFSPPASPDVRSRPVSHLRFATDASQGPPRAAAFEAQAQSRHGDKNATTIDNPASRNPMLSPFHVFRAPFAVSLIEIPEKRAPEILELELVYTSDHADSDAGESATLEDAIKADALYLEEAAVRSKKGMVPAERQGEEGKGEGEGEKEGGGEGKAEGEGEEEEAEEVRSGEMLVLSDELATPLHVYRGADGSLQEEPEMSDDDLMVFGSLDALYYEEVAVRTRAAHAQPRAPLVGPRASHAWESILIQGGASENRDQEVGFFRSFHVFRADNGSLVELTERDAVLTLADGVLAPLTEVNGIPLTELDRISSAELVRVHQQELPVRFRPSNPSTALTKIRRRLRLSHDKRIEIVYENTGSQRVQEETGEGDEEEEEEREHVGPVHVFWEEDGTLNEEEDDSTTNRLNKYDNEMAGLENMGWREAAVDAAFGAADDAAAEAEMEYELAFAVRTRRAMVIGGGED
ncbi:unnamed protein product [Closterium sp. Yama58-4]|nr:unnamed protein product [Closterium sp. Yama58-4]